ncbi:hypothetical protein MNV49_001816 [Pseudohyphozyma bogoriensis]|nr:hypothetical protein MNV49_001816 [Pseudohyphozyma bogoriensis]
MNFSSPTKRAYDEHVDDDATPTKRARQQAPPAELADGGYSQVQVLHQSMEVNDVEMDVEMDATGSDDSRWPSETAPKMAHQISTASLASFDSYSSPSTSGPTTPSEDLTFPDQYTSTTTTPFAVAFAPPSYPSPSNPTSFTDMNGVTRIFASTSPPNKLLSVYPTSPGQEAAKGKEREADEYGLGMVTDCGMQEGTIQVSHPKGSSNFGENGVRQLQLPSYGWDCPRQSTSYHLGGHLV